MDVFDGKILSSLADSNRILFQGLLPELIKKLIRVSCPALRQSRIPSGNDVWAPGYDCVVNNLEPTEFVCEGISVWEFGTSSDYLKKVNEDYKKRTDNPLSLDKNNTEIYLVVPRVWAAHESITEWERNHNGWKGVHVYDATILADWINSEPAVGAWLLEQTDGKHDIDFSTVSFAWKRFSEKTDPPLAPSLFLGGREEDINILVNMRGEPTVRVKSNTSIDAYGFCLAAILKDPVKSDSVIVVHNYATYTALSRFCKNKTFLLSFKLDADIIPGNFVILCYGKDARTVSANIELRQLPRSLFDQSMKDMGLLDVKYLNLYDQTHGNLYSLIRKIPGQTTNSVPSWASQEQISLLTPILLLGNFNAGNECDQKLVEYLADEKYEVLYERYRAWCELEDPPIKYVNSHFVLVNFEETWTILNPDPISPVFKRFSDVIDRILAYNNQHCDQAEPMVDVCSNEHLPQLFVDILFFSYAVDQADKVNQLVKNILDRYATSQNLLKYLNLLAEAAPAVVMDFLNTDIQNENGIINKSFANLYSHDYCSILFALDELTLHQDTRIVACDLLFTLCQKTKNISFRTNNSPEDSLSNALCLWSSYTLFSIDEKKKMLDKYLSKDKEYTAQFMIELIRKNHMIVPVHNSSKAPQKKSVSKCDLYKAMNEIAAMLFEYYLNSHSIVELKKLLEGYYLFSPKTLIDASKLFLVDQYDLEQVVSLNWRLREIAYCARKKNDMEQWCAALGNWIAVTTPLDNIGRLGWVFYDDYPYYLKGILNGEKDTDDYDTQFIEEKRTELLNTLIENNSQSELIKLVQCVKDSQQNGLFFAHHLNTQLLCAFIDRARECDKNQFLCGLLDGASKDVCIWGLNSLTTDKQLQILPLLSRQDIMDWIDSPDKEHSYWAHRNMYEYSECAYRKLLKYNPSGLLWYFHYDQRENTMSNIDKIKEMIRALLNSETVCSNHQSYELEELIKRVDQQGYCTEDWIALCIELNDKRWLQQYPNVLKQYYFKNPDRICRSIKDSNGNSYFLFANQYELPQDAYVNQEQFDSFVETLMLDLTDNGFSLSLLGYILGKSPNGADGIYPHEFVRIALEKYKDYDLYRIVANGKSNSFGVRVIDDGTAEMERAKQYSADAQKMEIDYPETAKLLRVLSDVYASQGIRDQLFSEIGVSAL